jgi:hypothetical protein
VKKNDALNRLPYEKWPEDLKEILFDLFRISTLNTKNSSWSIHVYKDYGSNQKFFLTLWRGMPLVLTYCHSYDEDGRNKVVWENKISALDKFLMLLSW